MLAWIKMGDKKLTYQLNTDANMDKLPPLKYTDYSEYYNAIVVDNVLYIDTLLAEADPTERKLLTNAEFDFKDVDCPYFRAEVEKGDTAINLPLQLAVTSHSMKAAEALLNHGADALAIDSRRNNILHACVITAFFYPDTETKLCQSACEFVNMCDKETSHQLLLQENKDSFRPLEFATQQGTLALLNCFMWSMDDSLRTRVEHHGMTSYTWHDVTEYESPQRHANSPLLLLTYLDRKKAVEAAAVILECPFYGKWIKSKVKINTVPMVIWAMLRIAHVVGYYLLDRDDSVLREHYEDLIESGENVSAPCFTDMTTMPTSGQNALGAFVVIYSIISLCFDIADITKSVITKEYRRAQNLKGAKDMIVRFYFYRICTSTANVCILIAIFVYQTSIASGRVDPVHSSSMQVLSVVRIVIPICACWSLMYFMQVLPYMGRSIVSIQGMLIDMANFLILWALFMLPFIHTFNVLVNTYSKQGCIKEFDGIWATLYTLFRMMLNMIELTQYDIYQAYFLYILHGIYVFMVAIILINFLIAIMSESASRTAENEVIIKWLNSLSIAVTVQQRFGGSILKPYYEYMMPRVFTKDPEGRFCIVTHTSRRDDIKKTNC